MDEELVNSLNRIDGVGAVSVGGAPIREVQVNLDPRKMEAYGLTIEQIGQVIASENVDMPAGTLDIGNNTYNVKSNGKFSSSDELYEIVLAQRGGREIYLKDVAEIKDTLEKATLNEFINNQRGLSVVVQKQSGANSVDIVQKIYKALPAIEAKLPKDVHIDTIMDTSEYIEDSISSLTETVMFAFLFVILVVLFFLGRWRATLIIGLTIPISLIVGFIYLNLIGSSLNIISLSSLSIAIGMVVDDAIVVLENITKHIERGSKPKEAAVYATNEVWLAVIATTLTVVAVFLPLTMAGGMAGMMFKELGWIVTLVICASTATAITLTPMLTGLMLRDVRTGHTYRGLGILFKPIDKFLDKLDNGYARLVKWTVHHRRIVLLSALGVFIVGLIIAGRVPTEFIPNSDNGSMSAKVELEQNLSVEYTTAIADRINAIIERDFPEMELYSASVGASSSGDFFAAMSGSGSHVINYDMRFSKKTERERSIFEIADLFRNELNKIPEIKRFSVTPGNGGGMGGGAPIAVKIFGYDFETTDSIARDLQAKISEVEGARDVAVSRDELRPELNVKLDRGKLAYYGLNSATVSTFIRNRINGLTATKYREDGEEYNVVVRYAEPFRESIGSIENILVYNSAGRAIRVGDVGEVVEEYAPPAIQRENRQRVVSVNVSLGEGVALGEVVGEIANITKSYHTPDDIDIVIGGTVEDQQESFADIFMLGILIIILVYIVMATQFESFVYPFINMATIVLAFPGVFLALWITNVPLGLLALIGAIMLIGIVVKNGIVMVDFTNLLRERGESVDEAVVNAGRSRLRPVLMTSLTTILGMLPLALGFGEGSELWQPMGIAVIGGLTFSMVLTLVVVPAMYSVLGNFGVRRKARKAARKQMKLKVEN